MIISRFRFASRPGMRWRQDAIRHKNRGRDPDRISKHAEDDVAAFLTQASPRLFPECIGEPYEDGSGTKSFADRPPILIYGADRPALRERSSARWRGT